MKHTNLFSAYQQFVNLYNTYIRLLDAKAISYAS